MLNMMVEWMEPTSTRMSGPMLPISVSSPIMLLLWGSLRDPPASGVAVPSAAPIMPAESVWWRGWQQVGAVRWRACMADAWYVPYMHGCMHRKRHVGL